MVRQSIRDSKQKWQDEYSGPTSFFYKPPASVPSANDLWSDAPATSPWADLFVPRHKSLRQEDPVNWDADPSISKEPLVYQPLSIRESQIRILTLLPCDENHGPGSPIRCTLKNVSLLDAISYEALSYTWGDEKIAKPIIVNGHKFDATENLHAALRELRNKAKGKTKLWVDAVCINQNDLEERSQQVLGMRSIYAKASRVIVWLGPESRNSNLAIHLLGVLSDQGENLTERNSNYIAAIKERSADAPPGLFAEAWRAFDDLFAREYWKRVWIIQEIAVAKKITVLCGSKKMSWSKVEEALWGKKGHDPFRNMMVPDFDPKVPARHTDKLFDFWGWRTAISTGNPQSLLKALIDSQRSKAKDPRDHVYALLGITLDGSTLVPIPNYRLPVGEVFTEVTAAIIQAHDLNVIALQPRSGEKTESMPSWVPDWGNLVDVERPWAYKNALTKGPKLRDRMIQYMDTVSASFRTSITGDIPYHLGSHPDVVETCYSGVLGTAEAIQQALCMLTDWSREKPGRDCADLLTNFWLPAGQALLVSHPFLRDWLLANREFLVGSVKLEMWLSQYHGGLQGMANKVLQRGRSRASKKQFAETLDAYMTEVEDVLRSGMRLMTTRRGRVGMAHPQARKGDIICILEGMTSMVILRPDTGSDEVAARRDEIRHEIKTKRFLIGMNAPFQLGDGHRVVGEAYIKTTGSAKKDEDFSVCPIYTFFIH